MRHDRGLAASPLVRYTLVVGSGEHSHSLFIPLSAADEPALCQGGSAAVDGALDNLAWDSATDATAIRDQANADAERATAALERVGPAITSESPPVRIERAAQAAGLPLQGQRR